MHILALVTDAFGGFGGIARYNRDLLSALASSPLVSRITCLPRLAEPVAEAMPEKIVQLPAIGDRGRYSVRALSEARKLEGRGVLLCGHILMAPLAALLSRMHGLPLWLQVHGVDAWERPSWSVRESCERACLVTSVSRYTRQEMLRNWWRGRESVIRILPNTVGEQFVPGGKSAELVERHALHGKKVILTVSRMTRADSYKGHDYTIAALKLLTAKYPDVVYLVVGDGEDVARLKAIVAALGVGDRVIFAGRVPDNSLVAYFQTADVFVMPSTKEGFGIVFLEAAACGLPVVAGNRDGSVDALAEGVIGALVDPEDPAAIAEALSRSLDAGAPSHAVDAVRRFSHANFCRHVHGLVEELHADASVRSSGMIARHSRVVAC